ncbi:glycosyltransferase family 2 protein [Candidatus Fermentibacteria bacterium]|nr:glycosyltransferase family 2 protein [Candidatus Fermentibacteria bacterium]
MTSERAGPSLSVVIPAYNEAENIAGMLRDVLRAVRGLCSDFEIIVVDDGSADTTAHTVRELGRLHREIRLVQHAQNKGYGAAVFDGLVGATKELVFFTDGDRQFDVAEMEDLLARIEGSDLVVGYRSPRRDPFMRRLNGKGWSLLITLLFGYTARDIDCAFKLMRRSVIERLRDEVQSRGATFSAEFLVRAKRAGFRIAEVPVRGHRPRVAGNPSGAKPSVIVRAFRELIRFRLRLWKESS